MSFFHRCALGYFDPESAVPGMALRAVRPLPRGELDAMLAAHAATPLGARPLAWWVGDALVVEYITPGESRSDLVRAIARATGATVVDVHDRNGELLCTSPPWRADV